MADKTLSAVVGGDLGVIAITTNQIVNLGATGDIVTLTPTSSQRIKITGLTITGSTSNNLMTFSFGGTILVTGQGLAAAATTLTSAGLFRIGYGDSESNFTEWVGKLGEEFIINNTSSVGGTNLNYSFVLEG